MTYAPSIIHVESPYVIRNLRDRLVRRKAEIMEHLRRAQDWEDFRYRVGAIDGLDECIAMLEQQEQKERN